MSSKVNVAIMEAAEANQSHSTVSATFARPHSRNSKHKHPIQLPSGLFSSLHSFPIIISIHRICNLLRYVIDNSKLSILFHLSYFSLAVWFSVFS